jgi:predicted  nucleic acid-binding Zn ribbon protein
MNIYDKLKPNNQVELCSCDKFYGVLLVDLLTTNPLNCFKCKNELIPEKLSLNDELIKKIINWLSIYDSLYKLWLDSGEYEQWAKSKLLDPKSSVNIRGLEIINEINKSFKAYYWWFYDADDSIPTNCPICNKLLENSNINNYNICENCHIVMQ